MEKEIDVKFDACEQIKCVDINVDLESEKPDIPLSHRKNDIKSAILIILILIILNNCCCYC